MEIILVFVSYLIGSISASIILCKVFNLPDPRTQGSGNAGATNVLRIGGKKIAVLTLLIDILKGVLPVLLVKFYFQLDALIIGWVAFAAFLGHLYPVYFKFQGGKGVATALGVAIAMDVMIGLPVLGSWIAMALIFKISSLASVTAAIVLSLSAYFVEPDYMLASLAMTILILWRHRSNIKRLLRGEEPKLGRFSKKT